MEAVISVSPSSGSGLTWPFTWTVSSPSGYSNLSDVYALFNTSVSGVNACYIRYNRTSNLLYLADNSGSSWQGGFVPGSGGGANNSQCSISGNGSSVSVNGNQLAMTVSVTFQTSFSGDKNNYLIAYDNAGLNSTWQWMGRWTVPTSQQQYMLTTTVGVGGGGSIDPNCPSGCLYDSGNVVTVRATQNSGYQFSGFSGDLSGTTNPQYLTMNGTKSVTASFQQLVTQTITTSPAGLSVTVDGVPCTTPCTYQWGPGNPHTVSTAAAQTAGGAAQYLFLNWSNGKPRSRSLTSPGTPTTYTAYFEQRVAVGTGGIYPSQLEVNLGDLAIDKYYDAADGSNGNLNAEYPQCPGVARGRYLPVGAGGDTR